MNFLFGFAIAIPSALIFMAVYYLIPKYVWAVLPPEIDRWRVPAFRFTAVVLFLVIAFLSGMTYGPRLEVAAARMPAMPTTTEVAPTETLLIEPVDRRGQFDDRLARPPIGHELLGVDRRPEGR